MPKINHAIVAEFFATFMFIFIGVGTVGAVSAANVSIGSGLIWISVAHGIGITIGIIIFGRLSGAHMNPAVTFSLMLSGKMPTKQAVLYIVAQLVGGVLAVALLRIAGFGDVDNIGVHTLNQISIIQGLLLEIALTFVLVFTVFSVAIDRRATPIIAPFAVGLMVLALHLVGVPLTGASMNPARSFAPALVNLSWATHWLYWIGPMIGGGLAAVVYTFLFGESEDKALFGKIKM